jgi:uncharacterized membrane protein YqjE
VPIDPDAGIPDLVRNLADDSKRLLGDEVRLAKLEMSESLKRAGKGGVWLAVAFGIGVIMLVFLTLLLVTAIGRLASEHYWVGALVTAVLWLVLAGVLVMKGLGQLKAPSYSLKQTREEAKQTVAWAAHPRSS